MKKTILKYLLIAVLATVCILIALFVWRFFISEVEVKVPKIGSSNSVGFLAETGNWQVYTNKKYGYEIKVPVSWQVIEKAENLVVFTDKVLTSNSNYYIYSLRIDPLEESSFEKQVATMKERAPSDTKVFEETPAKAGGLTGLRIISGDSLNFKSSAYLYIETLLSKDNLFIEFINPPSSFNRPYTVFGKRIYELDYRRLELQEKILSTFRFLE